MGCVANDYNLVDTTTLCRPGPAALSSSHLFSRPFNHAHVNYFSHIFFDLFRSRRSSFLVSFSFFIFPPVTRSLMPSASYPRSPGSPCVRTLSELWCQSISQLKTALPSENAESYHDLGESDEEGGGGEGEGRGEFDDWPKYGKSCSTLRTLRRENHLNVEKSLSVLSLRAECR